MKEQEPFEVTVNDVDDSIIQNKLSSGKVQDKLMSDTCRAVDIILGVEPERDTRIG